MADIGHFFEWWLKGTSGKEREERGKNGVVEMYEVLYNKLYRFKFYAEVKCDENKRRSIIICIII